MKNRILILGLLLLSFIGVGQTRTVSGNAIRKEITPKFVNGLVKQYSIAKLRQLRPSANDSSTVYYSTDTGKEGFWKIKSGSSESDNLGTLLVCANGIRLERIIENGEVLPEWFGAIGDGVTDDKVAIQTTIDYTVLRDNLTVKLRNKTYKINSRIVVDSYHTSIHGNCLLDFTSSTTGGILVVASIGDEGGASYGKKNTISGNIRIKGSGASNNQTGIEFNSPVAGSNSNLTLQNASVLGFQTGISFRSRAYNMLLDKCEVFNCGTCLDMPLGFEDYGEKIFFNGCVFYNSNLAVRQYNPNGAFCFESCSFDYNQKQFEIVQGKVMLTDCHIETSSYPSEPITLSGSGSFFEMKSGWLQCTGSGVNRNAVSICNIGQYGTAIFSSVFMNNLGLEVKYFNSGIGRIFVNNTTSYGVHENPKLIGVNENTTVNGSIEGNFIDGMIIEDTSPITNRTQGANMKMTISTNQYHTGSKSLFLQKVYGVGSPAKCVIFAKIKERSTPLLRFMYRKPNSNTGPIYFAKSFCNITEGAIPVINRAESFGSAELNMNVATNTWDSYSLEEPRQQAPAWATHVMITLDFFLFNGSGEGIYIDEFEVNSY